MLRKLLLSHMCAGILFILAALGILISGEIYVSYNALKVTEYEIKTDKIVNTMRICLIADLHDHRFGEKNTKLVKLIEEMAPDLILMDGDIINNNSADSTVATELISQLIKIAPVYYSLGNQEKGYIEAGTSELLSELSDAGAIVLEEAYTVLNINDNEITLAGMYEYAFAMDGRGHMDKEQLESTRRQFLEDFQNQKNYKIMMSHRPDSFIFGEAADTWNIDLVLSGHLHGGQVVLPLLGGLYAGDQGFFPKYVSGVHHFNGVKSMIITVGLGSDREYLPRANNKPEVVIINIDNDAEI